MFSRKLKALGYHSHDCFDVNGMIFIYIPVLTFKYLIFEGVITKNYNKTQ